MSKRRINKQQSTRMEKIQDRYRETRNLDILANGRVIAYYGKYAKVEADSGQRLRCAIRANLATLAAGDQVVYQTDNHGNSVIVSRHPRSSELNRPDKRGQLKTVAANINQIVIVVAPKPELSWLLLDSYLVMAENLHLNAVIVLNKMDLPCEEIKEELFHCYRTMGYPVVLTSNKQNAGLSELQDILSGHISVFTGQSGVGKSSLISALLPHEKSILTGEISATSDLGRHTTSNACFYHLPSGGALIDSPGVREFGLWCLPKADILQGFRELRKLSSACKFRNCNHTDSPGCDLIRAIKNKEFSSRRYENYIRMKTETQSYGHI